jgi:hypothetical protein
VIFENLWGCNDLKGFSFLPQRSQREKRGLQVKSFAFIDSPQWRRERRGILTRKFTKGKVRSQRESFAFTIDFDS